METNEHVPIRPGRDPETSKRWKKLDDRENDISIWSFYCKNEERQLYAVVYKQQVIAEYPERYDALEDFIDGFHYAFSITKDWM